MFQLIFTSIPIFIKEYIRQKKDLDEDLKFFSDESLNILNELTFCESIEGYRIFFKTNIEKLDEKKRFILDVFFNFFKKKLEIIRGIITYKDELENIGDSITNEKFDVTYVDEFGDSEKINLTLNDYNCYTYSISFMKI